MSRQTCQVSFRQTQAWLVELDCVRIIRLSIILATVSLCSSIDRSEFDQGTLTFTFEVFPSNGSPQAIPQALSLSYCRTLFFASFSSTIFFIRLNGFFNNFAIEHSVIKRRRFPQQVHLASSQCYE